MPIDLLIERWVAVLWLICGLSHALFPAKWAALFRPIMSHESGAFILAAMNLPIGLVILLGHNIWVWDLPVIVTIAGWLNSLKSVGYLLLPRSHQLVSRSAERFRNGGMVTAFRMIGIVLLLLGVVVGYDTFFRR